jgi:hypothetical protein
MSTQEPSYFEIDQPVDQSQNQRQESCQKESEMVPDEISADVAQVVVPVEYQRVDVEVEPHTPGTLMGVPVPVRAVPNWRSPRQSQGELRSILTIVLVVAFLTCLTFTVYMGYLGLQRSTETYFFTERAHQKIVINNDQGLIFIHSQSNGPFGFRVERYSQGFGPGLIGMNVVYTQYGAVTTITANMQPDILFSGARAINIDVTVPASDELQVHTGKGSITLNGLLGNVLATTNNGSLVVKNCQGYMNLNVGVGSISVSRFSGQLVTTVYQGNIEASQVQLNGQSSALASSGAITLNGVLDRHGEYHFNTNDGPVNLALPETSAFHLAIDSSFGAVTNDFGQLVHGKQPQAMITINTGLGAFSLHKMHAK